MKPMHRLLLAAAVTLAVFAGWRVFGQMQAERFEQTDPERALRWRADDPQALLALAERQLAQGDADAAQATARQLLRSAPLEGRAFRILAAASDHAGDHKRAFQLYLVAARRAPRDLPTRLWLAQRYLQQGQFDSAIAQIDSILRMSPQRASSIHPVLVQMAKDPAFADALARALRPNPPWRAGLLATLRDKRSGDPVATGQVMQALQAQGGLSVDEYGGWLDSLLAQGRWGEAYARWAGAVAKPGGRLPLLYNGDFAQDPSDVGFDWRIRRVPGVLLKFEPATGASGQVAYLQFLDRRIPGAGLEQPLLLGAGRYRLALRMRAHALHSGMGLQWQVVCAGPRGVVARGEPIEGEFGWRTQQVNIVIPEDGCPGQWLRLVNPLPAGAAQTVSGELWLAGFSLQPQT